MSTRLRTAVVGAGIAGIAAGIRMAVRGHQVTIWEAQESAGGKIAELRKDGFRWDMGPSLFTLPELVDELFALAGKTPASYLNYRRLEVVTRYFFPDGKRLTAWADPQKFATEVQEVLGEERGEVLTYLNRSREIYDLTKDLFLRSSLHRRSNYLRRSSLRTLMRLPRLNLFRTMHQANAKAFRNPETVKLFDRFATYNGSNPYKAPATLNVIPHLEHELGAFFPDGGMRAIVDALVKLATDLGVEFRFGRRVEQILVEEGRTAGLRVGGENFAYDQVICNSDIHQAYHRLLSGKVKVPVRTLAQEKSTSALIFYWGVKGSFPSLDLHNIFFSEDYPAEFEDLFERKTIPASPTVYVYASCKSMPADAPEGQENWFVMVNAPADCGQDWKAQRESARAAILQRLEKALGKPISELIVSETVLDPVGIEQRTGSEGGAIYGNSSNSKMSAFLRHANFSGEVRNLYFCGGSVHPGGGIPLCLLSARIVDDLVPR